EELDRAPAAAEHRVDVEHAGMRVGGLGGHGNCNSLTASRLAPFTARPRAVPSPDGLGKPIGCAAPRGSRGSVSLPLIARLSVCHAPAGATPDRAGGGHREDIVTQQCRLTVGSF